MQDAVPVGAGAMAAILGMDAQAVRAGCAEVAAASGEVVEAVNFNDPKQTVIAGSKAGVEQACVALKAKGAKRALLLPVSAPFHSSLMKPAAERLKVRLAATPFAAPAIRVVNNVDVRCESDPQRIRDALYRQAFGSGALGRGGAGDARAGHDARLRVRARQGAGRAWSSASMPTRSRRPCSTRSRSPRRRGLLA